MFHFAGLPTYDYEFIVGFSSLKTDGYPIRKSPDQSLLAAPRSLSQPTTSFFDAFRLGIHRMLFLTSKPIFTLRPISHLQNLRLAVALRFGIYLGFEQ